MPDNDPVIGTLNEGSLHRALKQRYSTSRSVSEHRVGDFVADVLDGDRIVEIQTRGFSAMKRKLPRLLDDHRVTLVHPIAETRHIVKLGRAPGDARQRRRSPKHGSVFDVFAELVSMPTILDHSNLQLDVVMIEEEELRRFDGRRGRRRGGWVVVGRRLVDVLETHVFCSMRDLFAGIDRELPGRFTTADLADAMQRPRRLGQCAAYCLRSAGVIETCDKRGNLLVYRRA